MARMMARNGARSESRFQRWRFWVAISPGALPQADYEWCAFGAKTTTPKAFRGQSMNQPRLHYVNVDLGNLVLTQLGPHFMLQSRWVHSTWEVQEKYHASFVLVK
jgi:hypothetical protein